MTPEEQLIYDILVLEERKIFLNPLNQKIKKAQKEDRDKLTMRQLKALNEYASTKAEEVAIAFLNWYENDIDTIQLPLLNEIDDEELYQAFIDQTIKQ